MTLTANISVMTTIQVNYGFGRPFDSLSEVQRSNILKYRTFADLESFIALFFLRLSACVLILRILEGTRLRYWTNRLLFLIGAINLCSVIVITVVYGTQCTPFTGIWMPQIHHKCYSHKLLKEVVTFFGGVSIFIDLSYATVPFAAVKTLQAEGKTKLMLCLLFCMSFMPMVCAIGKTVTSARLNKDFSCKSQSIDTSSISVSKTKPVRRMYAD